MFFLRPITTIIFLDYFYSECALKQNRYKIYKILFWMNKRKFGNKIFGSVKIAI